MISRDHRRAQLAFEHIGEVKNKDDKFQKKYGSIAHKLPILVHSAGLTPALHFIAARSNEGQRYILSHLAKQLNEAGFLENSNVAMLLGTLRSADFETIRLMARETQRVLLWYKRFTQSELKIEAGNEDET